MQAVTSHLATYLLLIHMVLGCCFHHAHACELECCPEPVANDQTCDCSAHDALDQTAAELAGIVGDLPADRRDHHQHQCEGDQCRFVVVERTSEQGRKLNVGVRSLSLAITGHGFDAVGKTIIPGTVYSHSKSGFSLREHLRLRVLLI
ncbi:MAG TPA: hypothetical protein QF564_10710 [Pirellulaceae bacterium]|nr:hypothetical protein [Pirellulaceae bacterium]